MEKRWVMDIWEKQGWEKQQSLSYTGLGCSYPPTIIAQSQNHYSNRYCWAVRRDSVLSEFPQFPVEVLKDDKENPGLPVSSSMAEHPVVKILSPEQEPKALKNEIFWQIPKCCSFLK